MSPHALTNQCDIIVIERKLEKYKIIWHLKEANLRKAVKTSQNNVNFLTAVFGTSSD